MRFRILPPPALALALLLPATAQASGAWQTYIHTRDFTDLIALPGEVWCATAESGLLHFDRTDSAFVAIRREPGSIASNKLSSLALDRSGRLWVATLGAGVSRFSADRSTWTLVNVFDGLPVDTVQVLEAQGDTVWIGTSQGIALWNGREVSGSLPDGNTVSFDTTFSSTSITGIVVLGADSLFLATRRGVGLAHISSGLTDWRPVNSGLAVKDVQALATDGISVFAFSGVGAYRFNEAQGAWNFIGGPGSIHDLAGDFGTVLCTSESGTWRWDGSAWMQLPGAPASAPNDGKDPEPGADRNGTVFVASALGLAEQLPGGAWIRHAPPAGPPGNDIASLAVDRSGPDLRLYVGTFGSGIGRFDGKQWRNWPTGGCGSGCDTTFANPIFSYSVLVDARGHKWFGCWSIGVDYFDDSVSPPRAKHFWNPSTDDEMRKHTWIHAGVVDANGDRWFGMDTPDKGVINPIGLDHYDSSDSAGFVDNWNPSNSTMRGSLVNALTRSRNGRIWIGYSGTGVDYFTPPATSTGFVSIPSTTTQDVQGLASYGDVLWVLAADALRSYSIFAPQQVGPTLMIPGGGSPSGFRPIAVGPDGTVWVTTNKGLRAFHPDGRTESFTAANSALADDQTNAVAVDPVTGVVWIGSIGGVNRYDPHYVAPSPPPIDRLVIQLYPNPSQLNGLGIRLHLTGESSTGYRGTVHDLSGRRVRRFEVPANGMVIWDGRDEEGHLVKPGVYFVHAEAGGREAVARVALLH